MTTETFQILSERIARLDRDAADSALGLQLDTSEWQRHQLGFRNAPLYELQQPLSPDDAWDVRTLAGGRRTRSASETLASRWAGVESGLLTALPRGSYLLVRSPRVPEPRARVLLGNEWVARDDLHALREQAPWFAYVVGSPTRGPLIGTVILNNDGSGRTHELLLFSFDETPAQSERLLVIPRDGELVLDNLAGYGPSTTAQEHWRDHGAHELARWCAGDSND